MDLGTYLLVCVLLYQSNLFRLVPGRAPQPPGGEDNPLGEGGFQHPVGREAGQHRFAVVFPVLRGFNVIDHGAQGIDAVADAVLRYG